MNRTLIAMPRSLAAALVAVLVGGLSVASTADAQQSRFRVLVPSLESRAGANANFGRDVANKVRERIDEMPTHTPVDRKVLQESLRRFNIREQELDCIKSRQLAVQMEAELVMCGTVEPGGSGMQVAAQFISAKTGEAFEVQPFAAANADQAADQIFNSFERYVDQLRLASFCASYLESSQWQNALENCRQALELNPQSTAALYGTGRALMEVDSLEESLAAFRRVLEINPVHGDALLSAGFVATKLNQSEAALQFYREYLELNPGSVEVRLKVALDLAQAGNPAGALQLVEEGLQQDSTNMTLREYAGHFALAAAQKAQEATGDDETTSAASLYQKALAHYEVVFAARGAEADSTMLRNMIVAYIQQGQNDRAIDIGQRAVQAKPGVAGLWSAYADALQKAGRLQQALSALDSVRARDPNYPNLAAREGVWYLDRGDVAQARRSFSQAIQRGEMEQDVAARAVFAYAFNEKYKKNQHDQALDLFGVVREMGGTAQTRAMADFFSGYILLNRAIKMQEPSTVASARRSLPVFQQALAHFNRAGAYQEQNSTRLKLIEQTQQYIDIQNALIRRG